MQTGSESMLSKVAKKIENYMVIVVYILHVYVPVQKLCINGNCHYSLSKWDFWKLIFSGKLEFAEILIRLLLHPDIAGGRSLSEKLAVILLNDFY